MAKKLEVVIPFFIMEKGDVLTLSENGKEYTSSYSSEKHLDDNPNSWSKYSSEFTISVESAKSLINDGILKEVEPHKESGYKNVFVEIDELLNSYNNDLVNLHNDSQPACLIVEKETVLRNLIKVLTHLKSFKRN